MTRNAIRTGTVVARVSVLIATIVCAAIWGFAFGAPRHCTAVGDWLRERWADEVRERFRVAITPSESTGPGRMAALANWSDELGSVRKLDALAPAVRFVEAELTARALESGDRSLATEHATRLAAFDDRDIAAVARSGALSAAAGANPDDEIERLTNNQERARHLPDAVIPLVETLVGRGVFGEAAETLCRAAAAQPGDVWRIQWSTAPHDSAWFVFRRVGVDSIEARLTIDAPATLLRFTLPAFRACALRDASVVLGRAGVRSTFPLRPGSTTIEGLHWNQDALLATGGATATIELGEFPPGDGPSEITIRATVEERLADAIREVVLVQPGTRIATGCQEIEPVASRFAALRARALLESGFELANVPLRAVVGPGDSRGAIQLEGTPATETTSMMATVPARVLAAFATLEITEVATDGLRATIAPMRLSPTMTIRLTEVASPTARLRFTLVPR